MNTESHTRLSKYIENKNSYITLCEQIGSGKCENSPLFHILKRNWRQIIDLYGLEYGCMFEEDEIHMSRCYITAMVLLLFVPMYTKPGPLLLSDISKIKSTDPIMDTDTSFKYIKNTIMKPTNKYGDYKDYFENPTNYPTDKGVIFCVYLGAIDHGFLLERRQVGLGIYKKYNWIMYQSWIDVKGLHIVNLSTKVLNSNQIADLSESLNDFLELAKGNKDYEYLLEFDIFKPAKETNYFTMMKNLFELLFDTTASDLLKTVCSNQAEQSEDEPQTRENVVDKLLISYIKKYIGIIFTIINPLEIGFYSCKRNPYIKMYMYNNSIKLCYSNLVQKLNKWYSLLSKDFRSITKDNFNENHETYDRLIALYKIYKDMTKSCPDIVFDKKVPTAVTKKVFKLKNLKYEGADYGNL